MYGNRKALSGAQGGEPEAMPADTRIGDHSTSPSGELELARASSELRLLDLDDHCLSEILVRALPPHLPWQPASDGLFAAVVRREGESVVDCGRVLRVCRRFRDALLSRATGRWVGSTYALLRFAPRLRRLEIARSSKQLPWRAVRSGDGLTITPPSLAHLTTVTQLELRSWALLAAGVTDVVALPLLRDLELSGVQIEHGLELQGLAALTALTRLHLPYLAATSAPPDSLECFSRLQALQTFGAPEAKLACASILHFIAALTALSALHLQGVRFDASDGQVHRPAEHNALLKIASEACGLKDLRYSFEHVTADGLSRLTRLQQLTVLDLTDSLRHLSERDLRRVAAMPHLRQLALTGHGCAQVPLLGELTALESLSLDVDEPSDGQRIAGLSALTHLRLHQRHLPRRLALGQPASEALATLSSLRELALCYFGFDSVAGAAVCALRGLRRLSLHDCKVTDGAVGALTQLHELALEGGVMEAGAMTQLALLTGLRAFSVGSMDVRLLDFAGIAMLTQPSRLELHFKHWDLQDCGQVELPHLTSLQDLTVVVRSIGQQGLDSMAALRLLTRLRVSCSLSFAGTVSRLVALQRLVTLDLDFRSSVTADELAALACALPELRQLRATVEAVPLRDSEVMESLAHLRGELYDARGHKLRQHRQLGLGL